ncbi:uncharacterized protein DUF4065 [Ochrobactrum sp. J50]|uniref:Panacea domain-containing protein n=1 Tax=Ochrobactrum sp. J50 TaxID=936132 RepID=UPI0011A6273E|nr:Panacea domain-containing protein [Ochrobactrum sp. J50]TWH01417.1 uncharacterized protein DUF4065 [Ochrobactrum sp. J50]
MRAIRFKFSPEKAKEALHWMVARQPGIDLHAALKAFYFADKAHLNRYFRPIFGATYRAMKFGPVPLEVYEMAKSEALWLAETGEERFPWRLDGYRLILEGNDQPDMDVFSETDVECLEEGFEQSIRMNFTDRTAATHGKDWQAANLGTMRYEDMIDENIEHRDAIIKDLSQTARYTRL